MNESDIVKNISKQTSFSKKQVQIIIDILRKEITTALKQGKYATIKNLFKATTYQKQFINWKNPRTGNSRSTFIANIIRINPSDQLKKQINNKSVDN